MPGSHVWEIRSPEGGAKGLEFARAEMDAAHRTTLVHAAPSAIDVVVTADGFVIGQAHDLRDDTRATPMSRLRLDGATLTRENIWPAQEDVGLPVILPGGEVGILLAWSNAEDGSEWTWRVEFHNNARAPS
jgi:hypothetical protein